ncbi:MAG: polyphosphate kinase 1 [Calditrichaceae bacterium]
MSDFIYFNRELSWLSFNHRVLQEAMDPDVPLYEQIKFMAIFSSNLDEFFRVRVAALRNLLELKKKTRKKLEFDPALLLDQIQKTVFNQQEQLGIINRDILEKLAKQNIFIITDTELSADQKVFAHEYFVTNIIPYVQPILLVKKKVAPFLQNKALYLAVKLLSKSQKGAGRSKYALVEIPTKQSSRFIKIPSTGDTRYVILIDDIIRFNLPSIFPGYEIESSYSIKLTRDAQMYLDDEFSGDLLEKIKKGLSKRSTGVPSRFLYDQNMPEDFLKFLTESLNLNKEDLVAGGRFHNFNDFFSFPAINQTGHLYEPMPPLPSGIFDSNPDMFSIISRRDIMVYFPYQSYDYVTQFLSRAANDPNVTAISITLYRVAPDSEIVKNLIHAAKRSIKVTAFVEVKARFDEEMNIKWAEEMENAGIQVLYSFPGLKVHSKICLISRNESDGPRNYCYISTGNFNEKTARIYCDFGFFSADKRLTSEISSLFKYLNRNPDPIAFSHLLVAPFNMRKRFYQLIKNEILNAESGKKAEIIIKLNSLQDKKIIRRLYEASNAGVKIRIIARGICCLIPGVKDMSENIEVISIIDRFLEHARVYIFHNGGDELYFTGSADWMQRNLSSRIEVVFPVYDMSLRQEIRDIIDFQLNDNVKARIIDKDQSNPYREDPREKKIRSQMDTYAYIKGRTET